MDSRLKPSRSSRRVALVLPLACGLAAGSLAGQDQDEEAAKEAALASTTAWLEIVDAGDYEGSWNAAAVGFQQAVPIATWVVQVQGARNPFGEFGERTLMSSQYLVDPPNTPPGTYVIIRFRTVVARGGHVIETVVPMLDTDGAWRVSGYFVAPT